MSPNVTFLNDKLKWKLMARNIMLRVLCTVFWFLLLGACGKQGMSLAIGIVELNRENIWNLVQVLIIQLWIDCLPISPCTVLEGSQLSRVIFGWGGCILNDTFFFEKTNSCIRYNYILYITRTVFNVLFTSMFLRLFKGRLVCFFSA